MKLDKMIDIKDINLLKFKAIDFSEPSTGAKALERDFLYYLCNHLGHFTDCSKYSLYEAMALVLRDRIMSNWHRTWDTYHQKKVRRASYLSLEFLIGRSLGNHVLNMELRDNIDQAIQDFCFKLEGIEQQEHDAGLGNGGLGRLAACFMDSCAALQLPVVGYGLRYEYGIFRQQLEHGYQIEEPDHWLREGNPWEIKRSELSQVIHFGGRTETVTDEQGRRITKWVDTQDILAIPYDVPVSGYKNDTVNTLRLWRAAATDEFSLEESNAGD
jgi:starch phosphorylase